MTTVPVAVRVVLPRACLVARAGQLTRRAGVRLEHGTPVALTDSRFGSRGRLRRDAARLEIDVEREYVVLPTWRRAAIVITDDREVVEWFLGTLATVPPGLARGAHVADLALRIVARTGLLGSLGRFAPGRVLVGTRR